MKMKWQTVDSDQTALKEQSDQGLHSLLRHICPNSYIFMVYVKPVNLPISREEVCCMLQLSQLLTDIRNIV